MKAHEVIMREVQRRSRAQVLNLLAESVPEPCEPVHAHSHGEVLPLNEACRYVSAVRASGNHDLLLAHDARRRVAAGANWLSVVEFHRLPVIHVCPESPLYSVHVAGERI